MTACHLVIALSCPSHILLPPSKDFVNRTAAAIFPVHYCVRWCHTFTRRSREKRRGKPRLDVTAPRLGRGWELSGLSYERTLSSLELCAPCQFLNILCCTNKNEYFVYNQALFFSYFFAPAVIANRAIFPSCLSLYGAKDTFTGPRGKLRYAELSSFSGLGVKAHFSPTMRLVDPETNKIFEAVGRREKNSQKSVIEEAPQEMPKVVAQAGWWANLCSRR